MSRNSEKVRVLGKYNLIAILLSIGDTVTNTLMNDKEKVEEIRKTLITIGYEPLNIEIGGER